MGAWKEGGEGEAYKGRFLSFDIKEVWGIWRKVEIKNHKLILSPHSLFSGDTPMASIEPLKLSICVLKYRDMGGWGVWGDELY
ncbi:MAG: hypothetical protein F6K22_16830 [Okeania sp. SIO2F4]|uniref:hypothetical protein n=1 Tax=Okeania sp. SIO2F4 TaxID=2607790 RepID=UPI00142A44A1|nr:hypothetical protein [Okeania sp. SIO2F4]NES04346.1 hypothetical protein [Okeania sp. SIO2F4]